MNCEVHMPYLLTDVERTRVSRLFIGLPLSSTRLPGGCGSGKLPRVPAFSSLWASSFPSRLCFLICQMGGINDPVFALRIGKLKAVECFEINEAPDKCKGSL